jgi:hypothetical protein
MIARPVAPSFGFLESLLRNAGPYLLLELIMPGGTVLALLLFYWQRRGGPQTIRRDVQHVMRRLAWLWNELVSRA